VEAVFALHGSIRRVPDSEFVREQEYFFGFSLSLRHNIIKGFIGVHPRKSASYDIFEEET
jgi:hypothetical protein